MAELVMCCQRMVVKAMATAPLEAMVVMRMLTVLMAAEAAAVAQLKVEVEVCGCLVSRPLAGHPLLQS